MANLDEAILFLRFGVALAIGVLVGIQREFSHQEFDKQHETSAGVRTFALLGLLGGLAAMVSSLVDSSWPLLGAIIVMGAFFTVNYIVDASTGRTGLTTKVSALFTLLLGAIAFHGHLTLAVALTVAMTILLSVKVELHEFVKHLTHADVYATLKFAVIAAIILPILPNKIYGPPPLNVFNPLKIWLLVVFISGMGFVGYILMKTVGARRGIGITGLLGGMVSSTAVTLSFTQRSKEAPELGRSFAMAILVAWTVMFIRVLGIVAVVNYSLLPSIGLVAGVPALVGAGYAAFLFFNKRTSPQGQEIHLDNPFRLGPAIKFGLLFTVILALAKAAQVYLGTTGVYLSSFISGLVDVDAIVISVARFSHDPSGLALDAAAWSVAIASVANTLLKGTFVIIGGQQTLRRALLPGFVLILASCLITAAFGVRG